MSQFKLIKLNIFAEQEQYIVFLEFISVKIIFYGVAWILHSLNQKKEDNMLILLFLILNCSSVQAKSIIINNSTNGSMTAVAGKGGIAVSGGIVVDGENIISSGAESDDRSEIKKRVGHFSEVKFENIPGSVSLDVDENNEPSVTVSAGSSVLSAIDFSSSNDVLKLSLNRNISTNVPVDIKIKAKELKGILSDGSADIQIKKVHSDSLKITIRGSSAVSADGEVGDLNISADGNGDFDLSKLKAKRCHIMINGSGDAVLHVTERFSAQINGSGDIVYYGNPPDVSRRVNGSGDVNPAE